MRRAGTEHTGLTRKELLGSAAGAATGLLLGRYAGLAQAAATESAQKMNVLLFITDQDRAIQHFPRGWVQRNMPGYSRLLRNGLSFDRAFTNACMCSPARSTLFSGYFPAQHGVKYTLEEDMTNPKKNPQVQLPVGLKNAASVMSAAGYNVVYKGKWHCSKPAGSDFTPADLEKYGFQRWDPPDGGANQDIDQAGGGNTNNDGRYITQVGDAASGTEGVLQYLTSVAPDQEPFFLIVSLVNPHDVLFYPKAYRQGLTGQGEPTGYDESWLRGTIRLPATVDEDLKTKPRVQREFRRIFNLAGHPRTHKQKRDYLNFYGNLIRSSDSYLVQILDTLISKGLLDNTLVIKTADHGEMGLAHGGLRQKNFNFYEESLRVPLVYSNPVLFPRGRSTNAMVSHVDFLPTLASIAGAPVAARADWQGVDYSHLLANPRSRKRQRYVVFTYDDFQSGQAKPPYPKPPNHIASIREERWKLAKYYDPKGKARPQWEMYDLKTDPLERKNLARPRYKRTHRQQREFERLKRKLARVQRMRLRPLT
jgi:arylsulfatase A-like enzyme